MKEFIPHLMSKENKLPIHLILEVTSRCNAKCATCFNWQKTDSEHNEPTLEELEKISKSLGRLMWFSPTGGEPFLRKDLDKIIWIFNKNNKPLSIAIPHNGLLPKLVAETCEKVLKFYKGTFVVTLSLDGVGDMHDKIRGVKGNFKNFEESYKMLLPLTKKYKNFNLGVNTTVNSINQDSIPEIVKYVKKLNVSSHTIEFIRGCSRDSEIQAPDLKYYLKHKKLIKSAMFGKSYYDFGFMSKFLKAAKLYYHDFATDTMKAKEQLMPCYAGRLSVVIDCYLNVYPCELYKKFGNLKDYDMNFKKLWFSKKADKIRAEIKNKCCYCTHSCFQFVNTIFNPKVWPKLIKYI